MACEWVCGGLVFIRRAVSVRTLGKSNTPYFCSSALVPEFFFHLSGTFRGRKERWSRLEESKDEDVNGYGLVSAHWTSAQKPAHVQAYIFKQH